MRASSAYTRLVSASADNACFISLALSTLRRIFDHSTGIFLSCEIDSSR